MPPKKVKHPLGRPPKEATQVLRLAANGKWVEDDGKPGLAFSGMMTGIGANHGRPFDYPAAFYSKCACHADPSERTYMRCPAIKAMDKTSERFRCANGRAMTPSKAKKAV